MFNTKIPDSISKEYFDYKIINRISNNKDKELILKFYKKNNIQYELDLNSFNKAEKWEKKKINNIFYSVKYKYIEKILNVLILQYSYDGVKTGNTLRLKSILND